MEYILALLMVGLGAGVGLMLRRKANQAKSAMVDQGQAGESWLPLMQTEIINSFSQAGHSAWKLEFVRESRERLSDAGLRCTVSLEMGSAPNAEWMGMSNGGIHLSTLRVHPDDTEAARVIIEAFKDETYGVPES
ncbi:MAG: hypothetical protein O2826_05235 [Chloroflexi bacterium]|nr:hypothetical protein [Chloroflexota bacterium]MDA1173908.1 hypothetical protein [Chloroflexota bacterium]